ncbi:MAG: class I SAM-dependent methyltransferase [Candidatus Thorarchaeota archaeon]|nr:class I SAM-dependent methyltransferase [Candidatus Thorarchaeota archaeon]
MPDKSIDYDAISKIYDKVRFGEPEMVYHLLQEKEFSTDSVILDIGCGTGNNTLLFQEATKAQVYGIDPSIGMLHEAIGKARSIHFTQAIAESIPFNDASFDMVFMTEVVHHLQDMEAALSEIHRVLRNRGHLCIATQSHMQIEERMTSRFFPATVAIDKARYPDIPRIEATLMSLGFRAVWSRSCKFAPVTLGEEYLNTVSRKGYSMLHKIPEAAFQTGLKALREAFERKESLDYAAGYTFVWAAKDNQPLTSIWT